MSNEIFNFDKILTYMPSEELIVSTYLLVDCGRVTKKDYLTELNSMISKTKENIEAASGFDKSKQKMIFNALDKIKSFVGDLFKNENDKTLLIYAGTKSELWEVYKLPIILKSKIIGTPAACACLMASFVGGITASSAAITITAMSVIFAPRARMAVNASWPGVSRKVIFFSFSNTTS